MSEVNCFYCGKRIPDSVEQCPHCGADSLYKASEPKHRSRRNFILFFIALVIFTFFMMFWLPR